MTKQDDRLGRLLRGVGALPAPPELRAPTLAKAVSALSREPAGDRWRRVWEDRRLRWAWAATAAVLIVANLALPGRHGRNKPAGRDVFDAASTAGDRELASVVALPRIDNRHLQTAVQGTGQGLEPPRVGDSERKENR